MRIVSWNCHYGLNLQKLNTVLEYSPNILLIQECRKNDFDVIKSNWKFKNWYNDDLNQEESELGIAIFSNEYKIAFTDIFNRNFRYVVPYFISNSKCNLTLFAVWIKPLMINQSKDYKKPLYNAVKYYYDNKMINNNTLFIGDFNTFAKDEKGLENLRKNIPPLENGAKNSKENYKETTYYHGKNNYGIDDFCFASNDILKKIKVSIPKGWDKEKRKDFHWKGLSDHRPIIVDINI